MVKFSIEQIVNTMERQEDIRNISVIAHVDHGKTTLTDSLLSKAGIIQESSAGNKRVMDTRPDENERSITIKSTSVSLWFETQDALNGESNEVLINLIDSPGHVDFSAEVTAALRVTDGALVVVDCIDGVCVQTETVLQQALAERIKPVLFLNKLDRVFLEKKMTAEDAYVTFRDAIQLTNVTISTFYDGSFGDLNLSPDLGNVGFGSGYYGWGFTLRDFANIYASSFSMSPERLMKRLWGDYCWHPVLGKWVKHNPRAGPYVCDETSETLELQRGFVQFIMQPIMTLCECIMNEEQDLYMPIIESLGLELTREQLDLVPKKLMKAAMQAWIPAGDALVNLIYNHLPSPREAQKYRCEVLYKGDQSDPICESIRNCDPNGEVSMYVSKMFPTKEKGRFIAYGRVFSGTIGAGQQIHIFGPEYESASQKDYFQSHVRRTILFMGRYTEILDSCPCGNMTGLMGVDKYFKCGTVTTDPNMEPFAMMKFSVSAIVQRSVETKDPRDLPKLAKGLKLLNKTDNIVKVFQTEMGEHVIAGAGELHMEICLKDLQEIYCPGVELKFGNPIVPHREGIRSQTGAAKVDGSGNYPEVVSCKSANKHNHLFGYAEPLEPALIEAFEKQEFGYKVNKEGASRLKNEFNWDVKSSRNVWTFGCPPDGLPNCVVDQVAGVAYVKEIRDHVSAAFQASTNAGILCREPMRGVRINLVDAKLHADAIHRGAGAMIPCARKVFNCCQLGSDPMLFEPFYLVDIVCPTDNLKGVYNTLYTRRGELETSMPKEGTNATRITAFLPVSESFGFGQELRANTGGRAFPQLKFSHWQPLSGSPLQEGSQAWEVMMEARARNGLREEIPNFYDYYDKLR
jgi:elongation factor 2